MRFVRLFLISIIMLFIVVFCISIFIPSKVIVSRAINVKADCAKVAATIEDMRHWQEWNPFFKDVTTAMIEPLDTTGGKLNAMRVNGTSISWRAMIDTAHIAVMERPGKVPVINGWKCIQRTAGDSITIQWYMEFHLHWYPWEKLGSLMFDKSYGPNLEKGLQAIKRLAESDHASQ